MAFKRESTLEISACNGSDWPFSPLQVSQSFFQNGKEPRPILPTRIWPAHLSSSVDILGKAESRVTLTGGSWFIFAFKPESEWTIFFSHIDAFDVANISLAVDRSHSKGKLPPCHIRSFPQLPIPSRLFLRDIIGESNETPSPRLNP